jgi:hypothetical protein
MILVVSAPLTLAERLRTKMAEYQGAPMVEISDAVDRLRRLK